MIPAMPHISDPSGGYGRTERRVWWMTGKDAVSDACLWHVSERGRRQAPPGGARIRAHVRRRPLDQLPFIKPRDDLLARLVGVLVLDDLARGLGRRIVELTALHPGAIRAHQRRVDAD